MTLNASDLSDEELFAIINEPEESSFAETLTDEQLLRIANRRAKGVVEDVATQVPVRGTAGFLNSPGAAARFGQSVSEEIQQTPSVLRSVADFFGFSVPEELQELTEQPEAFKAVKPVNEFLVSLGRQNPLAQEFSTGFDPLKTANLPTVDQIVEGFEEISDTDLKPQTFAGNIAGSTAEAFGEGKIFGPEAAKQFARARFIGEGLREFGVPESIAGGIEFAAALSKFERPRASKSNVHDSFKSLPEEQFKNLSRSFTEFDEAENFNIERAVDASEIIDDLNSEHKDSLLNTLSFEGDIENVLESLKNETNEEFTRARGRTSNLYDQAKFDLRNATVDLDKTVDAIRKFRKEIDTKGLTKQGKDLLLKKLDELEQKFSEPLNAEIAISEKQAFNDLFDFDFPDLEGRTKAVNRLSGIRKIFKDELKKKLLRADAEGGKNFIAAEKSHAADADRFGKDVLIKLQRGESPLDIRNDLKKPQNLGFLKEALKKDSFNRLSLDRAVLDELESSGFDRLKRDGPLFRKRLSDRGQKILDEFTARKNPASLKNNDINLQRAVAEEAQKAFTEKKTPKLILELKKSPDGSKLVDKSLNRTPRGRKANEAFNKLFVKEFLKDILTDEGLDVDKAKALLKDANIVKALKRAGGEPVKNFLSNLENQVKKAESSLSKQTKRVFNDILKNKKDYILALTFLKFAGVSMPFALKGVTTAKLGKTLMNKLLQNKKVLDLVRVIENKPAAAKSALLEMNKIIQKEQQTEEQE